MSLGIVHARDAKAQFESQRFVVAQRLRHRDEVLAAHLQGELVAEDHDPFDGGGEGVLAERADQRVDDVVEVAAVRPWRTARQRHFADEPAVAGRVAAALDAEHAAPGADDLAGSAGASAAVAVGFRHDRSSPLSSKVVGDASAACSAAAMASARLTPSGIS